ncbi:MAG: FtsB family cell division protein [Gaiellaceae bacterium]
MARRRASVRRAKLRRALLLAGLAVVAFLYYHPLRAYLDTKAELSQRAAEVQSLTAQKQKLERQLKTAGTPESLARAARMELSLVKPGERLFIVKGIDEWRRAQRGSK